MPFHQLGYLILSNIPIYYEVEKHCKPRQVIYFENPETFSCLNLIIIMIVKKDEDSKTL